MAKILNLRLNYKGMFLDYAKEGKEIKKEFFIGSNKFLQWQILDRSYPDKILFIKKAGDSMVLQLPAGASFTCEKDGKPLDRDYLTQHNLLSGNQLILDKGIKGNVSLHKDWDVDFEFREPWAPVLTEEQRRIVEACAQKPALTSVERFNRSLMLISTIIAVVFMIVFDLFLKTEQQYDRSVEDRLQRIENMQKVDIDIPDIRAGFVDQAIDPGESSDAAANATPSKTGTQSGPSAGSQALSGLLASGAGSPGGSLTGSGLGAYTTTAVGFSVGKKGSGAGTGTGGGAGGGGSSGAHLFAGVKGPDFGSGVGAVAQVGPGVTGYVNRPEGFTGGYQAGDTSKLTLSGQSYGVTARQQALKRQYQSSSIQKFTEESLKNLDDAALAHISPLSNQIRGLRGQIESAYYRAQVNMRMTLDITLYIGANGQVEIADITPRGAYPQSFLDEVKRICESSKFNWSEKTVYPLQITLK